MNEMDQVREKLLFNRKIKIGYTKAEVFGKRSPVYLEASIKEKLNQRSVDNKVLTKFKTLSISGHSRDFAGQIHDELTPDKIDFTVDKSKVENIKKIWKQWHLNDLHAGTRAQEKALAQVGGVNANEYDKQVAFLKKKKLYKNKGYKFGTGWLVDPLPENVEQEVMRLF